MGHVVGRELGGGEVCCGILELWRWTLEHCIVRITRMGVLCANGG